MVRQKAAIRFSQQTSDANVSVSLSPETPSKSQTIRTELGVSRIYHLGPRDDMYYPLKLFKTIYLTLKLKPQTLEPMKDPEQP